MSLNALCHFAHPATSIQPPSSIGWQRYMFLLILTQVSLPLYHFILNNGYYYTFHRLYSYNRSKVALAGYSDSELSLPIVSKNAHYSNALLAV